MLSNEKHQKRWVDQPPCLTCLEKNMSFDIFLNTHSYGRNILTFQKVIKIKRNIGIIIGEKPEENSFLLAT